MKLGFIGLGVMGLPMARNLMRAGHSLALWARRPEAAQPLLAEGAQLCASARELGAASEVVFTMVTSSSDVVDLVLGDEGVAQGAAAGSAIVDCSTIAPGVARQLAEKLDQRGLDWLDAPVSGGGQGAIDATLSIMVGGRAEVLARLRPLLECLGKTIVHIGPAGAGQVAKACNQMVMVAAIQACAEATLLARASGVDPAKVMDALAGGSAGSRVLDVFGRRMVEQRFEAGVQARLHHKDFGLLMGEAARLGVALPVVSQVWQQLNALMAQGFGGDDSSSLLRALQAASPLREAT